jgi:hypothetical protein
MRAAPFRFAPPAVELSAELLWGLRRAFGPVEVEIAAGDPAAAVELAGRLDLAARIGARVPQERLAAECGEAGAARLRAARAQAAAAGLRVLAAAGEVAAVAVGAGIRVAWLKFAGLAALGLPVLGSRGVGDLDLLVGPEEAGVLAAALRAAGFRAGPDVAYEHHLAALLAPAGVPVEIHDRLPGVRLAARRSATFGDLEAAGLLAASREPFAPGLVPAARVQRAHLLVHALAQHGLAPAAYPGLRLFGDLLALGAPGEPVPVDLSPREVAAAEELAAALGRGEIPVAGDARRLLDHLLAGALDARYREGLKLSFGRGEPSDLPPWRRHLAWLRRALCPSAAELAAIYGEPRGRGHRLLLRLWRPLDLAGRTVRALASRWRSS